VRDAACATFRRGRVGALGHRGAYSFRLYALHRRDGPGFPSPPPHGSSYATKSDIRIRRRSISAPPECARVCSEMPYKSRPRSFHNEMWPPEGVAGPARVVNIIEGKARRRPMKTFLVTAACCSVVLLTAGAGVAQEQPWWNGSSDAPQTQPPPASPPADEAAPQPAPAQGGQPGPAPAEAPPQGEPPPAAAQPAPQTQPPAGAPVAPPSQAEAAQVPPSPQVTQEMASQGEWVYTAQYGWTWVPYGSTATAVGVQPYVYLYAPAYGWRWFVSPWGIGPFHYGSWGWGPRWGYRYSPRGWIGGAHGVPRPGFGGAHYGVAHGVGVGRAGGAVHFGGGAHVGGGGGGHHR